jgi:hypothetical protein
MAAGVPNALPADQARGRFIKGLARSGMHVEGLLKFEVDDPPFKLPANLAAEVLDCTGCRWLDHVPRGLQAYELSLAQTRIERLAEDLKVQSALNLTDCEELRELPAGLTVGSLVLRGCRSLESLPESLDVWFLDMTGCWAFQHWPRQAKIRSGRLTLRGCTALTSLPSYLGPLAGLNLRDCPNIRELPAGLRITGWIDIAQSGLGNVKSIPEALKNVEIRWQGVRIDTRIWLHPETITVDEILEERNVERRRVLMDRFGIGRFVEEAQAEILDRDHDRGGLRQLVRVPLADDEPLVALSCSCPSTGHQYFLRVPPVTATCHQAAAWIAGFEDPDDYHPLVET